MTVIAADELDDLLAPRVAAREAQRAHRRLGAGVDHADELDGGIDALHELRELGLDDGRRAVARAARHRLLQCPNDVRVRMTDDHRPPGADVVDVFVAVEDTVALGTRDERRIAVDIRIRAHGTVDAARHELLGLLEGREGFFQM